MADDLGMTPSESRPAKTGESTARPKRKAGVGTVTEIIGKNQLRFTGLGGLRTSDIVYVAGSPTSLVAELMVITADPPGSKGAGVLAEVRTLRAGTTLRSLVGKAVITHRAARGRIDLLRIGQVDERDGAWAYRLDVLGRNATAAVSARAEQSQGRLLKPLLGVATPLTMTGGTLDLFAPALLGSEWLGWFGLSASLMQSAPVVVAGQSAGASGVREAKIEVKHEVLRLVVRPVFNWAWPSHTELSLTAAERLTHTATFSGDSRGQVTVSAHGPGAGLGVWGSPYDNVLVGLAWDLPLAKRLAVTDDVADGVGAGSNTVSGTYRRSDVTLWSGWRWPRPAARHSFAADWRAGVTLRDERLQAADALGPNVVLVVDTVPWLSLGASYIY